MQKYFVLLALSIFLTLATINAQNSCESINPQQASDCLNVSSSLTNSYCCYLKGIQFNTQSQKCYVLPKSAYTGSNYINVKGTQYNLNCGDVPAYPVLKTCGPTSPSDVKDCATGSTISESCCYESKTRSCLWLGAKYKGSTHWAGKSLECSTGYVFYTTIALFAVIFMFFF
jgi:hypothetical protein